MSIGTCSWSRVRLWVLRVAWVLVGYGACRICRICRARCVCVCRLWDTRTTPQHETRFCNPTSLTFIGIPVVFAPPPPSRRRMHVGAHAQAYASPRRQAVEPKLSTGPGEAHAANMQIEDPMVLPESVQTAQALFGAHHPAECHWPADFASTRLVSLVESSLEGGGHADARGAGGSTLLMTAVAAGCGQMSEILLMLMPRSTCNLQTGPAL